MSPTSSHRGLRCPSTTVRLSSSRSPSIDGEIVIAHGNLLLERLSADGSRLPASATLRRFELRDRLGAEGRLDQIVFPASAVVSILISTPSDGPVELGIIGRHGMVGYETLLGAAGFQPGELAQVQVPGAAWCIDRPTLDEHLADEPHTRATISRAALAFHTLVKRQVLCNALHTIDQRVSRWLLRTADEAGSVRFPTTQTFLSQMLGVRRASVNAVERRLADESLIRYGRGYVELLDLQALAARACNCSEPFD